MNIDESVFEYDELKLFFKQDYVINDYITICQPSISDIMEYGERKYYLMINCSTHTRDFSHELVEQIVSI